MTHNKRKKKQVTLDACLTEMCCAHTPIEIEIAEGDGTATDLIVRPEAARSCVTAQHYPLSPFSIRDRRRSIGFQSLT